MGNILKSCSIGRIDEIGKWEDAIKESVKTSAPDARKKVFKPVLFRADGSVYRLDSHSDLTDMGAQNHDAYIVGPHGEMGSFVFNAVNNGVLPPSGNTFSHYDAHLDNMRNYFKGLQREGIGFESIVRAFENDIVCFIAALSKFFRDIIACIYRPTSQQKQRYILGPMSIDEYLGFHNKRFEVQRSSLKRITPERITAVFRQNLVNVYSLDGDYCGVNLFESVAQEQLFALAGIIRGRLDIGLNDLEGMLSPELERVKSGEREKPTLYAVSLDPEYCLFPMEFIRGFVARYYRKLVEAIN